MGLIYKIENQINHKVYIGKTVDTLEKRWKQHILESRKPIRACRPLYAAIQKYGIDNFQIELVEENIGSADLDDKEQYWIQQYNSYIGFKNSNGYNATLGGDGTVKYNYKTIANYYLQIQNITETQKHFNCSYETVKKALLENNIKTNKQIGCKKVKRVSKNGKTKYYDSITDAARALVKPTRNLESARKAISKALQEQKVLYGFSWFYD